MATEVILNVNANGDVKAVTRKDTGENVRYDIVSCEEAPDKLHGSVSIDAFHKELSTPLCRALNGCITQGGASKVIPFKTPLGAVFF
jgi:hypothetical protein